MALKEKLTNSTLVPFTLVVKANEKANIKDMHHKPSAEMEYNGRFLRTKIISNVEKAAMSYRTC